MRGSARVGDGVVDEPDGLRVASAAGSGDPGDRDAVVGAEALTRRDREGARNRLADRPVRVDERRRHAGPAASELRDGRRDAPRHRGGRQDEHPGEHRTVERDAVAPSQQRIDREAHLHEQDVGVLGRRRERGPLGVRGLDPVAPVVLVVGVEVVGLAAGVGVVDEALPQEIPALVVDADVAVVVGGQTLLNVPGDLVEVIGAELGVSESAIKASLQQLFAKTGVRTRSQLVRVALERRDGV